MFTLFTQTEKLFPSWWSSFVLRWNVFFGLIMYMHIFWSVILKSPAWFHVFTAFYFCFLNAPAFSPAASVQRLMWSGGGGWGVWGRVLLSVSKIDGKERQAGGRCGGNTRGKRRGPSEEPPSKQSAPEFLLSADPPERERVPSDWKPPNALQSTRRSLSTAHGQTLRSTLCGFLARFVAPLFVSDPSFPFFKAFSTSWLQKHTHGIWVFTSFQMLDIREKMRLKMTKGKKKNEAERKTSFCAVYLTWLYLKHLADGAVCVCVCGQKHTHTPDVKDTQVWGRLGSPSRRPGNV